MDHNVLTVLKNAGIDTSLETVLPIVPVALDADKKVVPLGAEVAVQAGEQLALVTLRSIPELFVGSRAPPSFARPPPKEYLLFFALVERTAIDFCTCTGEVAYDEEFERLYRQLRRRPDGEDGNPLFSYIQGAARLFMSLRDVSQAEFDAVVQQLVRFARRHGEGAASKNYYRALSEQFAKPGLEA